jgi:hypothetical protein
MCWRSKLRRSNPDDADIDADCDVEHVEFEVDIDGAVDDVVETEEVENDEGA